MRRTKAKSKRQLQAERDFDAALRVHGPRVTRAFLSAVQGLKSEVTLAAVRRLLESGDIRAAAQFIDDQRLLDRASGRGLTPGQVSLMDELRAAMVTGSTAGQRQLGPRLARQVSSLNVTNPLAVEYLTEVAPDLIRAIGRESRDAIQVAMVRSLEEGRPVAQAARDIRGSIGLRSQHVMAVERFREQLETGTMLGAQPPWMRRLSAVERRQARSLFRNPSPDPSRVVELVEKYRQRLLNRRAEDIARSEVSRGFAYGQQALWDQAVDEGLLQPGRTRRKWLVTPDERLRDTHAAIPMMNPDGVGLTEEFAYPGGSTPGPHRFGVASEDVNCRCTVLLRFDD